jgi:hypothetical protein
VYKPLLAIFFVIIVIFGVAIFSISYKLGNSSFIKLLSGKGFPSYNKGIYTETMTYFDTALAIKLNDSDVLNDKGNDLSDLGNHTEAIKYYDMALAIEPNHVDSLYDKGNSLNRLGNYTEAIEYYDRVLAIEPDHPDALSKKRFILNLMQVSSDFLTYQHPDLGFTVEYPSNAEVEEEHVDGVVFLIQEGSVLINIRQLSEEQTLEQFTDERRISLQESFENVEFPVETIPTTLIGGYLADQTIFGFDSYDSPGERMLGILVTSVVNGTIAVQLLFAGNAEHAEQPLNVFLHMKNTFDVSGPQQEIQSNENSNRILSQQNVTEAATNITEEISQLS